MSENPCAEGIPCFLGTTEHHDVRFTLIGLIASADFQQCLTIIELLHRKKPAKFTKPYIRPMLEFDWVEYKTKAQRKYGGKLWRPETSFTVYANDLQLATGEEFLDYISQRLMLPRMDYDYECLALCGVAEMYEKYIELGRTFVYISITLNAKYVGSLLIMLYYDLLPKTCRRFLRKCNSKKHGYAGTLVHRIMSRSWIQFADFVIPIGSTSNESYVVPHNRRGILSMCSNRPHNANKTQFFITLNDASWMDYHYVAFGQVMQGDYVLRQLENLPTSYERPTDEIIITSCGELKLDDTAMAMNIPRIEEYLEERNVLGDMNVVDVRDAPSILIEENYRALKYCYFDDYCSHSLTNVASALIREPSMLSYTRGALSEDEDAVELYRRYSQDNGEANAADQRGTELTNISELEYLKSVHTSVHLEGSSRSHRLVLGVSKSSGKGHSGTRAASSTSRRNTRSSVSFGKISMKSDSQRIEANEKDDDLVSDNVIEVQEANVQDTTEDAVVEDAVVEDAVVDDADVEDAVVEDAVVEDPENKKEDEVVDIPEDEGTDNKNDDQSMGSKTSME